MATSSDQKQVMGETSQNLLNTFVKVVDKLAGEKSNLKVSFQDLKFNVGKTKMSLNGEVNFNVVRSTET